MNYILKNPQFRFKDNEKNSEKCNGCLFVAMICLLLAAERLFELAIDVSDAFANTRKNITSQVRDVRT